jgi:hypothetical protein
MHATLVIGVVVGMAATALQAAPLTITDQNASLKFTIDEPGSNLGAPNDPVQLPRKLEWTVDGRRILVYPSGPFTFVDVGHLHAGLHVAAHQMHAQGPMLGYGTGGMTGTVLGGTVYSVHGGAAGSGISRISEKIDIHNKSGGAVSMSLAGMGYKPPQAALEVPDYAGLSVTGTTTIYYQGNPQTGSLTEAPFAPVTVLPVVSFTGFNPLLNQNLNLPAGARLTMVTELKVERLPLLVIVTWLLVAIAVAAGLGFAVKRSDRIR